MVLLRHQPLNLSHLSFFASFVVVVVVVVVIVVVVIVIVIVVVFAYSYCYVISSTPFSPFNVLLMPPNG